MLVEGLVILGLLGFFISVPAVCISYTPQSQQSIIIDPFNSQYSARSAI